MKVDINKKYRTRDGCPVRFYAIYEGQDYAVHGAYQRDDGNWRSAAWRLNGYFFYAATPSSLDLVEVRPKRVLWINEYGDHLGFFENKVNADLNKSGSIALHRVVLNEDTVWREDDASV